ncbi:MAG TPA: hypothetical protein VFH48_44105 [Chloroflexota bacterium]|nr:hypothetical protein [Chloroflexota bacterium]
MADEAPSPSEVRMPRRTATPAVAAWLPDLAVAVALFVVASVVLLRAAEAVPFHGDESEWIAAGRYFRFVFLDHDLTGQVWRPSWLNRDQPPLGRYIIGGIVWASGTDPDKVNRTYAWERDYEANLREGRVPEASFLTPVRRTMAVVGGISIVLLFVAGRLVGGTLVGGVAGLVATSSPLLQSYFVQARTEALLALFSTLALVALLAFARRYQQRGTIPLVAWSVGPILGLALATKLTAALAIVGACAYGGVAALARIGKAPREAATLIGWCAATGLLATLVWVAVNPFLWPDPVGGTWSMLTQQQSIMVEQGAQFGNPVTEALPGRLVLMVQRSFVENSTPAFDYGAPRGSEPLIRRTFWELPTVVGVSVELVLAAVGLAVLLGRVASVWWSGQRHGPETALLWWLDAYFLGIAANLSLDWPRYYVPTALYGAILIGIGVQAIVMAVVRWRPGVPARAAEPRAEAAG